MVSVSYPLASSETTRITRVPGRSASPPHIFTIEKIGPKSLEIQDSYKDLQSDIADGAHPQNDKSPIQPSMKRGMKESSILGMRHHINPHSSRLTASMPAGGPKRWTPTFLVTVAPA